jgi:hypothetical protein
MKNKTEPQAGSYEAALTEEQRNSLHALLLSGITLAEAQTNAPPWPQGPDKDKKPSQPCLWRIQARLRTNSRMQKIESVMATFRATQRILKGLVNKTDQELVLDQAMMLIGQQVIDAGLDLNGPSSKTAAAWLLLRRADQRRFDARTAILAAEREKARKKEEKPKKPPLTDAEKEAKWRQIFGMQPL